MSKKPLALSLFALLLPIHSLEAAPLRLSSRTIDPEVESGKTLAELVKQSKTLTARRADGVIPNPSRWRLMMREDESGELTDYEYVRRCGERAGLHDSRVPVLQFPARRLSPAFNVDPVRADRSNGTDSPVYRP